MPATPVPAQLPDSSAKSTDPLYLPHVTALRQYLYAAEPASPGAALAPSTGTNHLSADPTAQAAWPGQQHRAAAAAFFTEARRTRLPKLRNGDAARGADGNVWIRRDGLWVSPEAPDALALTDVDIRLWWAQRHQPGSHFTLVHRLDPTELNRLSAPWCIDARQAALPAEEVAALVANGHPELGIEVELPSGRISVRSAARTATLAPSWARVGTC
jgi:hypothetical protein